MTEFVESRGDLPIRAGLEQFGDELDAGLKFGGCAPGDWQGAKGASPSQQRRSESCCPESCTAHREVRREALTGVHIGQPLSREMNIPRVPTPYPQRKATRLGALSQAPSRPGVVIDPGMCARSLYGNREISGLTSCSTGLARIGKARSRSR